MNKIGAPEKDRWRAIGSELGLSVSDLNSIRSRQAKDPMNCISKVFDRWRSGMTRKPITWQTVLVALCKPQVGLKERADKVNEELP